MYLRDEFKTADARLRRLAQAIERLAKKDEATLRRAREIDMARQRAAAELFIVCDGFVGLLLEKDFFFEAFEEFFAVLNAL